MLLRILLFTVVILLLTACACEPKVITVTDIQYKPIEFPTLLLEPCNITEPPAHDVYDQADTEAKEELLINYGLFLIKDLSVCNEQIKRLKDLYDGQTQTIKDMNKSK